MSATIGLAPQMISAILPRWLTAELGNDVGFLGESLQADPTLGRLGLQLGDCAGRERPLAHNSLLPTT